MRITNSKMYKYIINKPLKMILLKPQYINGSCRRAVDAGHTWYITAVNQNHINMHCPESNIYYKGESFAVIDDGCYCFECADFDIPTLSNKNQKNCILCGCPTEQRRDFSDMSIREFCPRCKI